MLDINEEVFEILSARNARDIINTERVVEEENEEEEGEGNGIFG